VSKQNKTIEINSSIPVYLDSRSIPPKIPIGYADGFDRRFSQGKGYVFISGQEAPIIGNICMDMCMVDMKNIQSKEGDEVCIFGENPSIIELATLINTIPYELLTSVSPRVKRVYIHE